MSSDPNPKVNQILLKIFQEEMGGVIRYLHYSFMIMGHNRIPIQAWFRDQAQESMNHAISVGEKITSYGGHPTLKAAEVPETKSHQIDKILEECLEFEKRGLELYTQLVGVAEDDIALEEFARQLVREEKDHIDEVEKMLKRPK